MTGAVLTREALLTILSACAQNADVQEAHYDADAALIVYLDDRDIARAYDRVTKEYT